MIIKNRISQGKERSQVPLRLQIGANPLHHFTYHDTCLMKRYLRSSTDSQMYSSVVTCGVSGGKSFSLQKGNWISLAVGQHQEWLKVLQRGPFILAILALIASSVLPFLRHDTKLYPPPRPPGGKTSALEPGRPGFLLFPSVRFSSCFILSKPQLSLSDTWGC